MFRTETNSTRSAKQTKIYTTDRELSQYPFCAIPNHFFERMLARLENQSEPKLRTVLSIRSHDGRQIMRVTGY